MTENENPNIPQRVGKDGTPQIRENHLDFLYELYKNGVEIGIDNVTLLTKNGYIQISNFPEEKEKENTPPKDVINENKLSFSTERQKDIDANIDIVFDENNENKSYEIITDEELNKRREKNGLLFEGRSKPIEAKDWMPKSTVVHEKDFVDWINSINELGFSNKFQYRKFTLYVQQAYSWLQDKKSYTDFLNETERDDYIMNELDRCYENTLYFVNKYGFYKEGDDKSGKVKFVAIPVHEVMIYLNDCGYSAGIAKPRQIAATTTLMLCDVKDIVFKRNYFMKFITEDQEKAEEIFEDKLKYAFSELPYWMKPNVLNERDNLFKLGYKEEKGERGGVNSTIRVVPPKRTAIAGGAPQKVKVDEAGNIKILSEMINNARPTMYYFNPATKTMEIKRQLWFWGTGGEMEKGGKAFETEFMAIMKNWKEGNFSDCIIPVFFDWTTRPGISQEIYDNEKKVAYSKEGPNAKQARIEFHQSYPSSLNDVFRSSGKTLLDEEFISANLARIIKAKKTHDFKLLTRGFFEPIYDYNFPTDENSDVGFKVIGATFIPTEDIDARATVTIFSHPKEGWKNRYFQGTDPIATYTGTSNMASAIYDKHHKTISAVLDWRIVDYRQVFLQTMLLGLYYDTSQNPVGVKELLESNIGANYTQYKEVKGYLNSLTMNYELPEYLQNNSTINEGVGVDNKGARSITIINRMHEVLQAYGSRFYIEDIFEQLQTFTSDTSPTGKTTWGPVNRKYYKDDILFAVTYAYICAELCYPELVPQNIEQQKNKVEIRYQLVYDANFNAKRIPVKVKVNG